jgi:hypothetical protein
MWNITSSNVQRAKDELVVRRTEFEKRYAEERQALDAELAAIEALERAASEFMLRHTRIADGTAAEPVAAVDPAGGVERAEAETGGSGSDPATAQLSEHGDPEAGLAAAVPSLGAERSPAGGGEVGGLDILKPGSRWRFYRGGGTSSGDVEGDASEPPSSGG